MNNQAYIRPNLHLRMTRQRQMILDEVKRNTSHPTADEVYRRVRRRLPHISLATVYRNLDLLRQHELIQEVEPGGSQRRFDGQMDPHYHVRCVHCGCVGDVFLQLPAEMDASGQQASDYQILGHRLEFVGICPPCSAGEDRRATD